jgi:general stress protein YciG
MIAEEPMWKSVTESEPPPDPEKVAEKEEVPAPPKPRRRGFAAMDRDRVREIARLGGQAAHRAGTAHEFTPDEARVAGRKGGTAQRGPRQGEGEGG